MVKLILKRNATDPAMFEIWSGKYLAGVIHEDTLAPLKRDCEQLVLVEEKTEVASEDHF
jgi:hypothetical protein